MKHLPLLLLALLGACELPAGHIVLTGPGDPLPSPVATVAQVDALQDQLDALASLTDAFASLTDAMPACVVDPTLDCVSDRQLDREVVLLQSETQWQKVRIDELERDVDALLEVQ